VERLPDGLAEQASRRRARMWVEMTLQRIAWLVTVAALLIGALIMLLSHYQGYAALFAAVAASAAINLR
jgi:hypothetical protein